MVTTIRIFPNSSDDWSTTSPFSGYTNNVNGFFVSNVPSQTITGYTEIPSSLLDIGKMNQKVDILKKLQLIQETTKIQGVGGLAKQADVSFTLENTARTVDPIALIGRQVKFVVNGSTAFTGKIYKVKPSLNKVVFSCRSRNILDTMLGTLANSPYENYADNIIPILYGDFTYDQSFMPVVLSGFSQLDVSTVGIEDITDLFSWDEESKVKYKVTDDVSNLVISADNKRIILGKEPLKLDLAITDSGDRYIEIYVEQIATTNIVFKVDPATAFTTSTIYKDDDDNLLLFKELNGSVYTFWCIIDPDSATIQYVSGTDNGTLTIDTSSAASYSIDINDKKPHYIQIDDEIMHVFQVEYTIFTTGKFATWKVYRGMKDTDIAAHADESSVIFLDVENEAQDIYCQALIPCLGFTGYGNDNGDEVGELDLSDYSKIEDWKYPAVNSNNAVSLQWDSSDYDLQTYDGVESKKSVFSFPLVVPKISVTGSIKNMRLVGRFQLDSMCGDTVLTQVWFRSAYNDIYVSTFGEQYAGLIGFNTGAGKLNGITGDDNIPPKKFISDLTESYHYDTSYLLSITEFNGATNSVTFENNSASSPQDGLSDYSLLGFAEYDMVAGASGIAFGGYDYSLFTVDTDTGEIIPNWFLNTDEFNDATIELVWACQTVKNDWAIIDFEFSDIFIIMDFMVNLNKTRIWAQGKGTIYDGTYYSSNYSDGTLIDDPASQIESFLRDQAGITNIDQSSFQNATTKRDGYKSSFAQYESTVRLDTILKKYCDDHGLIIGENQFGNITMHAIENVDVSTNIANSQILMSGNVTKWSEAYTDSSRLITSLDVRYAKRHTDSTFTSVYNADSLLSSNLSGAEDILDDDRAATFDLTTVFDLDTVKDISRLVARLYTSILRIVTVYCTLGVSSTEVGKYFHFSSDTYIKGTTDKKYLCIEREFQAGINDKKPYIKLVGIEFDATPPIVVLENTVNIGAWQSSTQYDIGPNQTEE